MGKLKCCFLPLVKQLEREISHLILIFIIFLLFLQTESSKYSEFSEFSDYSELFKNSKYDIGNYLSDYRLIGSPHLWNEDNERGSAEDGGFATAPHLGSNDY